MEDCRKNNNIPEARERTALWRRLLAMLLNQNDIDGFVAESAASHSNEPLSLSETEYEESPPVQDHGPSSVCKTDTDEAEPVDDFEMYLLGTGLKRCSKTAKDDFEYYLFRDSRH